MKSNTTTVRINANATRILSGAIIVVGISMLITNAVMTTPFIMGIALSILGAVIIILAQRNLLKPLTTPVNK